MATTKNGDVPGAGRVPRVLAVATVMVAAVLVAATGTVGAVDSISSCREINASNVPADGGVEVTSDLTYTGTEACIEVTTDNVTVFGRNHTISGTGTGFGFWANGSSPASANIDNVTAVNLTAEGLASGFVFNYTDEAIGLGPTLSGVRNVVARNNANAGILERENDFLLIEDSNFSGNDVGIRMVSSLTAGATVRDNNVTSNGEGIVGSSQNTDYLDNYVARNTGAGVRLSLINADDAEVGNNIVEGNGRGIVIGGGGDGNNVHGNVVSDGSAGIVQRGGSGHTVAKNTVTGVSGPRLRLAEGADASITDLDIGASTAGGTTLDAEARNVTLRNVSMTPTDPVDEQNISRYVNATSTSATGSFLNVTFEYTSSDVSGVNESTLDVWKNNGSWTELGAGPATDAAANEVQFNVTKVGGVFAPLANTTPTDGELNNISSCRTINASNAPADGLVNLTKDINNAAQSPCINVTVGGVTFDGRNHTIDSDPSGGEGINASNRSMVLTGVVVRNVTLTDWSDGIRYADSVVSGVVTDVNVTGVTDNAIDLAGASNVVVNESVILGSGSTGVYTQQGGDMVIDSNVIRRTAGAGIRVFQDIGNVTRIRDNVIEDTGSTAISSVRNSITVNNTVRDSGRHGIYVQDSDTRLIDNRIVDSDASGIRFNSPGLASNPTNVSIENTTVTGSGRTGIRAIDSVVWVNDTTIRGSDRWTLNFSRDSTVRTENLDIGPSSAANTTLDLEALDVSLTNVTSPPDDPTDEQNISRFVEATNTSATGSFLNVTFEYTDGDVSEVDESTLDVWKNNGSWTELGVGPATDVAANEVQFNVTNVGSFFGVFGEKETQLFTQPLIDRFSGPPTNIPKANGGFNDTLYEDLDGDGDGTDVDQTVAVFGELIRGNDLNGDAPDGSLTDEQARKFNWNQGSPETEVTPADMVSLFGRQIRAE